VRIFWNANSTLEASKAEVSINDSPFSAVCKICDEGYTGKRFRFFCWDSSKMSQVGFIPHQHNDNVGICVVTKLFEPTNDIFVGDVFGNVIHK
jgi:hypothetical protein